MSFLKFHAHSHRPRPHIQAPPSANPRSPSSLLRAVLLSLLLSLLLLTDLLGGGATILAVAHAVSFTPAASSPATLTLQRFLQQGQSHKASSGTFGVTSAALTKAAASTSKKNATPATPPPPSAEPATMRSLFLSLDRSFLASGTAMPASAPVKQPRFASPAGAIMITPAAGTGPLVIKGSDGHLEVDLPRGSLDFSTATRVGGGTPLAPLTLQITQLSGQSVGSNNLLGRYLIQVLDSTGKPLQGIKVRHPFTIRYHYQAGELSGLHLNPNGIFLSYPSLIPLATAGTPAPPGNLVVPFINNTKAMTLTAQTSVLAPAASTTGGPSTFVPPPTPLLASVQGNSGQLTYDYPISVAPGPGGFQPQLKLSYSSQATNERRDPRSPADSAGDGWSIPMPSITQSWFGSNSAGDGAFYYTLSDVDHVSDRLAGADSSSPHVKFVTEHGSHLRILLNNTNNTNGASACFHVWGLDGTYYEIGCTIDSSQCAIDSNGNCSEYLYNVNKIVAPFDDTGHVRMMLITYNEDMTGSSSSQTVRDSVIRQIRYGIASSPTASSLTSTVGTVDFLYHGVQDDNSNGVHWVTAYGKNYNCSSTPDYTTTLRCDDTRTVNSLPAPSVMSTFELDSVISYVGKDDSSSKKAYQVKLKYQDDPANESYQDPITHDTEGAAGHHELTSITPTTFQNGTAQTRKSVKLTSTILKDHYYDSSQPSNTSYAYQVETKWPYLTSYIDQDTGSGGTASYLEAHNNTYGTPYVINTDGTVDDRHDPLYCTLHAADSTKANRCEGNYSDPDEHAWSNEVVTQTQIIGTDSSASALTAATTTYRYQLGVVDPSHIWPNASNGNSGGCFPIAVSSPPGQGDCVSDTWVAKSLDGSTANDWKDYYHGDFVGFQVVYTSSPAKNLQAEYYYTTEGYNTYASDAANYNSGQLYQSDIYQGNQLLDSALLTRTTNTLTGEGGNATSCDTSIEKLYPPCLQMTITLRMTDYEGTGSSNANAPWVQTDSTYDDYSLGSGLNTSSTVYHELLTQTTSSSNAPTQTKNMRYQVNDQTTNGVVYYHLMPTHSEVDDSSGHVWQCQDMVYDEGSSLPAPSGGLATSTIGYSNCADQAHSAIKSYTAYDAYGNVIASVDGFGAANSTPYQSSGCQAATTPTALSGAWTMGRYTGCTTYDSNFVLPTSTQNVLGQGNTITYDATQGNLPTSMTDLNGQKTTLNYSYDANGDETIQALLPGETGSYTSKSSAVSNCNATSTLPCYETNNSTALYPNAVKQTFYDSQGREAETRTPLDATHDIIVFSIYNNAANSAFQSLPFRVSRGSGWIDPNGAKDDTGATPAGTATYRDALGRVLAEQDALLGSSSESGINCAPLSGTYTSCTLYGLGAAQTDGAQYTTTTAYDPNDHMTVSFSDALKRIRYAQWYSVPGSLDKNITTQKQIQYNALDLPITVIKTDLAPQSGQSTTSVTSTATYDDLGQLTSISDPDRGNHTYTYDADGRELTDVSGSRIIGTSYDLLGRTICLQDAAPTTEGSGNCSSGSHPLLQNVYDQSKLGTSGGTDFAVGRLTQSIATTYYPDGSSASVTQQFQHDQRGNVVTATMQVGLPGSWNVATAPPTYQMTVAYNDANQEKTTQTSAGGQTGYTFTQAYDSTTGIQVGLSNNAVGAANLATLGYNANGQVSDINFQTTTGTALANDHFGYDSNLRPVSTTATWQSGSGSTGTIFANSRLYDAAGNVLSVSTTHAAIPGQSSSGGSETQNFCYDAVNRLVWAGNSGTQPAAGNGVCGTASFSNTMGGNAYSSNYAYTNLGQLWQGPLNGTGTQQQYLYCDSTHPHQLTGLYPVGTSCANLNAATYSSSYDSWGNVISRTYNGSTAQLSYDALDHFVQWDAGTAGKEWYAYDLLGERVLRRSTTSAGTTITIYAFGLEEHVYDGSGTSQGNMYYYTLGGHLIGELTNTGTQFFLTDALGSVLSTFSATARSAAVLGNQVYGPYGNKRYATGSMGTNKGFTGQYDDALSGLSYYNARYYDPVVGRFLSADTVEGNTRGLDPYTYVSGNPETLSDPTGLCGFGSWGDLGDCFSQAAQQTYHAVQQVQDVATQARNDIWQGASQVINNVQHMGQVATQVAKSASQAVVKWVIATVVAVVAIAGITGAIQKSQGSTDKRVAGQIRNDAHAQWQKNVPRQDQDNTNYGGGQLTTTSTTPTQGGPKTTTSSETFIATSNPKYGQDHTEKQTIDWAARQLKQTRTSGATIKQVKLILYTLRAPCTSQGTDCAGNLQNGTWARRLADAAGIDVKNVEISVWTSDGDTGKKVPVEQWP